MTEIQELLKRDVESSVGFKIKSTTEAKNLHKLLIEKQNSSIGLSTIRRLWELVPSRKPNQKTLDELAKFIDYKSFLDYNKHKSKDSSWIEILKINQLKFKKSLSKTDLDSLTSYFFNQKSPIFHINLIENAILTKKWQVVFDIFDPTKNELLIENGKISGFSAKIANLTCEFLYHLPKKNNETIRILAHHPNFKNYCIYVYIDILRLNKEYGAILKEVKSSPLTSEEKLFHSLIDGLHVYLNNQSISEIKLQDSLEIQNINPVLRGRYLGYQILYLSQNKEYEKEEELWNLYLTIVTSNENRRELLHEFVVHMILGKRMNKLEYLLKQFHDDIFDGQNPHNYLDQFIFNLIDVIVSIYQNDLKRAVRVFSNLSIKHYFENSYCDYYLIFYYLIGSHLDLSKKDRDNLIRQYETLANKSGFSLFSAEFRIGYFE